MPDTCTRCGGPLDARARTVAGHRLCEFCAVIAEVTLDAFLEALTGTEDEWRAWKREQMRGGQDGDRR